MAASSARAGEQLNFDKTFNARNEPEQVHYVAVYRLDGIEHRVEVWRYRDLRLKRRTDDAIETYVVKAVGGVEWKMTVMDLKRKIRTDVDRTNLFRIGHFTDWFALSHALTRPVGAYELTAITRDAPRIASIASCRWYLLSQGGRSNKICWSPDQHLPLVIADHDDRVQWKISDVASRPLHAKIFAIDDRGFVRNDANEDIKAD